MSNNELDVNIKKEGMSREEVAKQIILQIQNGNTRLEQKFAAANKKFVAKIAVTYANKGVSILDLVKAGMVGIVKAAHRYDTTSNFTFQSYAQWWVRQEILQSLKMYSNKYDEQN